MLEKDVGGHMSRSEKGLKELRILPGNKQQGNGTSVPQPQGNKILNSPNRKYLLVAEVIL